MTCSGTDEFNPVLEGSGVFSPALLSALSRQAVSSATSITVTEWAARVQHVTQRHSHVHWKKHLHLWVFFELGNLSWELHRLTFPLQLVSHKVKATPKLITGKGHGYLCLA